MHEIRVTRQQTTPQRARPQACRTTRPETFKLIHINNRNHIGRVVLELEGRGASAGGGAARARLAGGWTRRSPSPCRCRAPGGRARPVRAAAARCAGRAPATGGVGRRAPTAARTPRAVAATLSGTCPATTGTPALRSSHARSSRTATRAQSR